MSEDEATAGTAMDLKRPVGLDISDTENAVFFSIREQAEGSIPDPKTPGLEFDVPFFIQAVYAGNIPLPGLLTGDDGVFAGITGKEHGVIPCGRKPGYDRFIQI